MSDTEHFAAVLLFVFCYGFRPTKQIETSLERPHAIIQRRVCEKQMAKETLSLTLVYKYAVKGQPDC